MTTRLKRLSVLLVAGLLYGCPQPVYIDVDRANLMPDSVARQVVERRFPPRWLDRPFLDLLPCFRSGVEYVVLNDIRGAWYTAEENTLWIAKNPGLGLDCENAFIRINNINADQAREITAALVSLGASIRPPQ